MKHTENLTWTTIHTLLVILAFLDHVKGYLDLILINSGRMMKDFKGQMIIHKNLLEISIIQSATPS